jgi:hypothetical protein
MPTCRDIITTAYRMANVIGAGDEPTAIEAEEGLDELQTLYDGMIASRALGALKEVYASQNMEAEEFTRVTKASGVTVTLPATIDTDNELRAPVELACVEIVGTGASVHENGAWVNLYGLTLDSEAPLASKGRNGLAAMLSVTLSARHGSPLPDQYVMMARRFNGSLIHVYQAREPEYF